MDDNTDFDIKSLIGEYFFLIWKVETFLIF